MRVPSGDHAGTTSSPVWPTDFNDDPSHGTRNSSDGMLRCARCWPAPPVECESAYIAPPGSAPTVWPAAEKTIWHALGENRGACRYQNASLPLMSGPAFEPSMSARQSASIWLSLRWTYTIVLPSGLIVGSAPSLMIRVLTLVRRSTRTIASSLPAYVPFVITAARRCT